MVRSRVEAGVRETMLVMFINFKQDPHSYVFTWSSFSTQKQAVLTNVRLTLRASCLWLMRGWRSRSLRPPEERERGLPWRISLIFKNTIKFLQNLWGYKVLRGCITEKSGFHPTRNNNLLIHINILMRYAASGVLLSCCLIAARSARKFWALFHRFYTGKHDFVAFWVLRFRLKSRFDRDFRPKNKLAIWPKILTQIAIWPRFLRGPPHPQGGGYLFPR